MNWTEETPTVEGLYWFHEEDIASDEPEMVVIQKEEGSLAVYDVHDALYPEKIEKLKGKWFGPLTAPPKYNPAQFKILINGHEFHFNFFNHELPNEMLFKVNSSVMKAMNEYFEKQWSKDRYILQLREHLNELLSRHPDMDIIKKLCEDK
jgi:hypothetical protein